MNTTKCPVCDWDINDGGINVKVGGKEITVCCDDCAKKAEADPASLRLRLRESGAISGTVQGAVATWRLRERPLRRRQVATAPCTVPQPSRTRN